MNRINDFKFTGSSVENNYLFSKVIVGSQKGTVAEFIKEFSNIDWVKNGLDYLPKEIAESATECPFCQEKTITKELLSSIKNIFDLSYKNDVGVLKKLQENYLSAGNELEFYNIDELIVTTTEISNEWELTTKEIKSIHRENVFIIENKLRNPSISIELKRCDDAISKLNETVKKTNALIDEYNKKLDNKSRSLNEIKMQFWNLMRWDYNQILSLYEEEEFNLQKEKNNIISDQNSKYNEIISTKQYISELRKQTVNVEEAIESINNALLDIGIAGFSVVKYGESFYRIARFGAGLDAFHTLSEGEKTVISFLYFIELCKGEKLL